MGHDAEQPHGLDQRRFRRSLGWAATPPNGGPPPLPGRSVSQLPAILGRGDEIAAAASMMMGQADEGRPLVVIRGLQDKQPHDDAARLIRPDQEDLFR